VGGWFNPQTPLGTPVAVYICYSKLGNNHIYKCDRTNTSNLNYRLCKYALPEDEHVRPETYGALSILKLHSNSVEVCLFIC
jgi:hypothetical protein